MSTDVNQPSQVPDPSEGDDKPRRRILIGSQRDPDAYRPQRERDWEPIAGTEPQAEAPAEASAAPAAAEASPAAAPAPAVPIAAPIAAVAPPPVAPAPVAPVSVAAPEPPPPAPSPAAVPVAAAEPTADEIAEANLQMALGDAEDDDLPDLRLPKSAKPGRIAPPSVRQKLTPELQAELDQALDGMSIDDVYGEQPAKAAAPGLELETAHTGRVVAVRRDDVFLEFGGREQGVISLRQLTETPEIGSTLQVVAQKYNAEEGLYELTLPNAAAHVADWGDVTDGMVVEAKVTGHNTGGLECEVNHIRGFIPMSQIAAYRVEHAEEFVGQTLTCLVTEANRERRNLVLSRRAMLDREKEQARQKLMGALEVGQVYDGVVRKLMDFGAFVDIGGVDGLLHVSQLSWARVKHPSDVLQEGQPVRVRINKIDPATGRISLGYREMMESPWAAAAAKYPAQCMVRGVVTKIMEFGAFVQLEPGIEGLVHVSELSPKRIWRVSDVVAPGQEVEALVLSIDSDAQRISLSMKAVARRSGEAEKEGQKKEQAEAEAAPLPKAIRAKSTAPLKGGTGRASGGDKFGLKW